MSASAYDYWWGTGEDGTEPGDNDEPAARLAQLLAGWNVYHPATEWLLRQLRLPVVGVHGGYFADGARGPTVKVNLDAGGHLTPVDATTGVTALRADVASQDWPRELAEGGTAVPEE